MGNIEHWIVDAQAFREAVWAVERENFRPGNALDALERARVMKVKYEPADDYRGAVEALTEIASYHEHGKFSAITPAVLARKAQRALDNLQPGGQ